MPVRIQLIVTKTMTILIKILEKEVNRKKKANKKKKLLGIMEQSQTMMAQMTTAMKRITMLIIPVVK